MTETMFTEPVKNYRLDVRLDLHYELLCMQERHARNVCLDGFVSLRAIVQSWPKSMHMVSQWELYLLLILSKKAEDIYLLPADRYLSVFCAIHDI